jgi:NAD(P)-dependent dehydrogenase (short-subunit alcohol dehydrogenase family)
MPDPAFLGRVLERNDKRLAAVVTGAAGDLGRAVTKQLIGRGAKVLAVDIDMSALRRLKAELASDDIQTYVADVSDETAVEGYASAARELGPGFINYFFNNAGIEGVFAPICELSAEAFDNVMAVNVRGVFLGIKYILPLMTAGGVIVNTASTAALRGASGLSAYIASKHAVLGLTRSAALEAAPRGIRVCAICPGPIEGKMMSRINRKIQEEMQGVSAPVNASGLDCGRYATCEEVAASVMFLFSSAASFVTGSPLIIDGGKLAGY